MAISRICISMGDPNGIGPEVILKSLARISIPKNTAIVLIGSATVFEYYQSLLDIKHLDIQPIEDLSQADTEAIYLYWPSDLNPNVELGQCTAEGGKASMLAVEIGMQACLDKKAQALVTAPISKEAVNLGGYAIVGHTEFLAQAADTKDFMMILANKNLRVALQTIHIPIAKVAEAITEKNLHHSFKILEKSVKKDFKKEVPRIAVLGLNPHAGDGGYIGREEIDIITPAIHSYLDTHQNIVIDGPFPADGFFGSKVYEKYDAVLAMYHDQGLAPFKSLCFNGGVNFTAGLPYVRTSPDHGTAYAIAGKNQAHPGSFLEALEMAVELIQA